jgi:twitching motility protein PilT
LEDPVEFVLPHELEAVVNQRELGESFPSFPEGLRDALRQDPDIVFVGELRDTETMETAFTAAETGHMVFATVHTHDAASTVMRLVNSFSEGARGAVRVQLSQLLQCVVSQTLLPRSGGKGRVAAYEVLANTTAVAANLRKEDGHNRLKDEMLAGGSDGMQLMEAALAKLVISGTVSKKDALFKARDEKEFTRLLAHYSQQASATRGRGASAPLLDS